jgi:GT2 family glycosyltransferase
MKMVVPISAVVATQNRAGILRRTLDSLLLQEISPAELIVVDSSEDEASKNLITDFTSGFEAPIAIRWCAAVRPGAAAQRNEGVALAKQPFIWFFDDDITFEPNCLYRLWKFIESDRQLGGLNAMIVNQRYQRPGTISRLMFTLMHGRAEKTFAGKVIGPAINLLPEDRDDLPDVVPVEWLNTTCTIYRRESLPDPPFPELFGGYSLMEDLALSLNVAKRGWKLANVRTAKIFHDSQSSPQKLDVAAVATMELLNRHYVMTQVLEQRKSTDYLRLLGWEIFSILSTATTSYGRRNLRSVVKGKWKALRELRKNA